MPRSGGIVFTALHNICELQCEVFDDEWLHYDDQLATSRASISSHAANAHQASTIRNALVACTRGQAQ